MSSSKSDDVFDRAEEYGEMLARGLRITGENKDYFMYERIKDLVRRLPSGFAPATVLDYGCGTGETSTCLAHFFPKANIIGVDTAVEALAHASEQSGNPRVTFRHLDAGIEPGSVDLCYVNGVFHHIPPERRAEAAEWIYQSLSDTAYFALFENNPWNPGTRLVMRRIPFDRDAVPLNHRVAGELLKKTGFPRRAGPFFLFYFPRALRFLRFAELWLSRVPLGGQYYFLAAKT